MGMKLDPKYHALNSMKWDKPKDHKRPVTGESFHKARRDAILKKHPEILELYGTNKRLILIGFGMVVFMWLAAWYFSQCSNWLYWSTMYLIGGAVTHDLMIVFHASGHGHVFKNERAADLFSIFCNFGQGIPSAIAFKRYHYDHHIYLGEDELDPDLPTDWEIKTFRTPFMKTIFLILMVITYSIRPLIVRPKKPIAIETFNIVTVILVDILILYLLGFWPLVYIIGSTVMGMSLHPFAFHFIARHYEFSPGIETYSYYGWFNHLFLNMGIHVEHHDFPGIPPYNIKRVREIAPEFYEEIIYHDSYFKLIYQFIFNEEMGLWSRMERPKSIKDD